MVTNKAYWGWCIITRQRQYQEALQYTDDVHIHPAPQGEIKVIVATVRSQVPLVAPAIKI